MKWIALANGYVIESVLQNANFKKSGDNESTL